MTGQVSHRAGTSGPAARFQDRIAGLREVLDDDAIRAATHEDTIDGVEPSIVAEPSSIEEAATVMAQLYESCSAVAPRGAGTKMGWGNPPSRLDIIMSTRRLNHVLEHAAGDLVTQVQAGVTLQELQRVLGEQGQWLPLDPIESGGTIGGIIAANSFGPRRLHSGTVRDLLIGFTYVLPDGTVAKAGGKVVKNVAGYDLGKLFCGSLGTLGLIGDATFRVYPCPETQGEMSLTLGSGPPSRVAEVIQVILNSSLVCSAIVFQREHSAGASLSVRFEGVHRGVQAQLESARALLGGYGSITVANPVEGGRDVVERTEMPARPERGAATLKIGSVMTGLSDVIWHLENTLPSNILLSIWGFAAPPVIFAELDGPDQVVVNAVRTLRRLLAGLPASVVLQHATPEVKRSVDVWGDIGDALPLMRQVKERFDPRHIMNPGRFVGGM